MITMFSVSRVVLDSRRTSSSVEGIADIAVCYLGEPGLINRTSKVIVSAESPTGHDFVLGKIDPIRVTSVATGEQFDIIGEALNSVTNAFYIMLYESVNGESGSGFWARDGELFAGGGRLYVLSGNINISAQTRKDLDIPPRYKHLTTLSVVKIDW